jgi:hypothetical protein
VHIVTRAARRFTGLEARLEFFISLKTEPNNVSETEKPDVAPNTTFPMPVEANSAFPTLPKSKAASTRSHVSLRSQDIAYTFGGGKVHKFNSSGWWVGKTSFMQVLM